MNENLIFSFKSTFTCQQQSFEMTQSKEEEKKWVNFFNAIKDGKLEEVKEINELNRNLFYNSAFPLQSNNLRVLLPT